MKLKMASAALPLLTCLCGPAQAQSTVSTYGAIDVYVGNVKNTGGTLPQGSNKAVNSGGMTTSFIGFRGAEDLSNGLKTVFNLESFIRADTGQIGRNDSDPFWARLAVVGLESPTWGRVTLGRHVTPYSLATTNFTPFAGSTTFGTAFANVFKGNVQGDTRFNNSIRYTTPAVNGFIADAVWSLGQEIAEGPNRHRDQGLDGVVRYAGNGWGAVVGTRQINLNNGNNGRDQKAYMVGASYDFKVVQVFGQVHGTRESFNNPASDVKRRTYESGVGVPIGPGSFMASYARSTIRDGSATTPDRRQSWALGYDYNLSKRTDLYAVAYSDQQKNPQIDQEILAAGIRHRF